MKLKPAQTREDFADNYRAILREMKRLGLKVSDMPEDVAESTLALHQNALLVEGRKQGRIK